MFINSSFNFIFSKVCNSQSEDIRIIKGKNFLQSDPYLKKKSLEHSSTISSSLVSSVKSTVHKTGDTVEEKNTVRRLLAIAGFQYQLSSK